MRLVKAEIKHVYLVHKTYTEYLLDTAKEKLTEEETYNRWTHRLASDHYRYVLLMHGKQAVGMVWGRIVDEGFLIEGRFLRRAFRVRSKFKKDLLNAQKEIAKDFERVLMILPRGKLKLPGKYKIFGVLVEQTKRGSK